MNKSLNGDGKENRVVEPAIIFFEDAPTQVSCTIPGKPFAKQRPRASRRGRYMTVYTPKETINYESLVRYSYYEQNGAQMLEGALSAHIIATFPIPESVSKKKRLAMEEGRVPHIKKPDCDNVAKICLDALNGVAFNDDSHIIDLHIEKRYGKTPNMYIEIEQLPDQEDN